VVKTSVRNAYFNSLLYIIRLSNKCEQCAQNTNSDLFRKCIFYSPSLLSLFCFFHFLSCVLLLVLSCLLFNCCWLAVCIVVVVLCMLLSYMNLLYNVCIAVFNLVAILLARSQYSEGPATGHLDTGFSCFLCVYKQMLKWFPRFQVATTCFSCSPPDLNLVVNNFMFCLRVK